MKPILPGQLFQYMLKKKHIYIINGYTITPVYILSIFGDCAKNIRISLSDGTVTDPFKTIFYPSYKEASKELFKTVSKIYHNLSVIAPN